MSDPNFESKLKGRPKRKRRFWERKPSNVRRVEPAADRGYDWGDGHPNRSSDSKPEKQGQPWPKHWTESDRLAAGEQADRREDGRHARAHGEHQSGPHRPPRRQPKDWTETDWLGAGAEQPPPDPSQAASADPLGRDWESAGRSDGRPQNRDDLGPDLRRQLPALVPESQLAVYAPPAAYAEPPVEEPGIDLRKYLWLLFKHRWLIASSAGIFVVLGLISTFLTTPVYRASATIQINRDAAKVVDFEGGQAIDGGGGNWEFYQTQYELLRSRALAERVAADLNLQDDPLFLSTDAPPPLTKIKRLLFGQQPVAPSGNVAGRQKGAAGVVRGGLSVEPIRESSIVRLNFDSPNPQLAQKIVNAVAEAFIASNLERRYESSTYAKTFLEERLAQLKIKLEASEKQLVAYAEKQRIVSANEGQTLVGTNLAAANDALATATSERVKKELLLQQIQATENLGLPKILQNEAIAAMRARQVDLAAEYQDKLSLFKPAFPEMLKLKAQIDEIDRQIAAEVALIKESVKAELNAAISEEQSLLARVEALKAEVTDFRNRNIQYNILQREVDTNRQLYDGLLQRYKEIGVAGGVGTNNISMVDSAQVPGSPYTPRLSRNLAIALMLGLLVGGAGALAREHFDDTFKSPEEVEESLGLPLLGIIPAAGQIADAIQLLEEPRSALAEAFRSLRTALQFSTSGGVPKSLLITSSRPGEGKSTTALSLAHNFAQLGMRVLLIDADLRKPALHRYLNLEDDVGLTNYLAGTMIPPEAFRPTAVPGLTVMPAGPTPPNPAELLVGPKMLSLLTVASQEFDLVIIDGPPVSGLADAPLLASMASGTLLVIDAGGTRRGAAKAALKRLHFARAQMVGAVINKLDLIATGYSYGYGYGYGYGDHTYYGEAAPARLTHNNKKKREGA